MAWRTRSNNLEGGLVEILFVAGYTFYYFGYLGYNPGLSLSISEYKYNLEIRDNSIRDYILNLEFIEMFFLDKLEYGDVARIISSE